MPWQPSSGAAPGSTGAWGGEPGGYPGGENYPPPDGGGFGYGQDGGYAGQGYGQQEGQYDGQYGDPYAQHPYEQQQPYQHPYEQQPYPQQPYEQQQPSSYEQQQPYGQYNGYGAGQGQNGAGGYGGPQEYPQHDAYGYDQGQQPTQAYEQTAYSQGYGQAGGYEQAGYDQRPALGYGQGSGGYQDPAAGYGQPPAYPAPPSGTGGYPAAQSGTGGYPASRGGSGGRLALPSGQGGHSAEDAGNDWYGGQPAAANGASFADTGTYRLNGSVLDEYGTGPREAMRDPVRGFPPGPGQPGTGPQAFSRTGAQGVAETRQQERYDDRAGFPDYGQDEPDGRAGRGASGSFQSASGRDGFSSPDGYAGGNDYAGSDDYAGPDDYATSAYGRYEGPASPPQPAEQGGDGYNNYGDGFDGYDDGGDPYQDRYGDGAGSGGGGRAGLGPLRGKRLIFAALAVVAVGILGAAAYVFVLKPSSPASNANAQGPLPTSGAQPSQQACVKQLGTYCHIQAATDDPTPLTVAELFPPAFTNEKDKASYSLVSTKEDKTCGNAVIGTTLIKALQAGKCTQVLRGSYVSGDNKIMGTIGVINLSTTNEAHYAGKDVGQNDFIAPLTSKSGVASKLGNGTGVVEAEFKGHYLILTWSEFVNGANPTTKAQDNQLEQFSNDLVAGTANIDLSQRMVTGAPASPAASASASK